MLNLGKNYKTKNGDIFCILARKGIPASNGCDYIGENVRTGVIAHFNHKGEHAFAKDLNLITDRYKWIGIEGNKLLTTNNFRVKEELLEEYKAYLRIENDKLDTVTYVTRAGFLNHYV